MRTATATGTATVTCAAGDVATGGGVTLASGALTENFPTGGTATTPPTGWQATTTTATANNITAYVICADLTP
ncbi:hypothetical protein ACFWBB_23995 [Streptomyces sp. NPDC060000]|uniref:hypothetical protein n=1 Tax=Streptomyces sp. NPDC060000 TaxID=3347031 RepID=UPI0036AD99F6